MSEPVRITKEKAQQLLRQTKWLLIACVVAFAAFCFMAYSNDRNPATWVMFAIYWFAGVGYFVWLGRLAHGLRRSVVCYVGGTWLASSVVFLFAHVIAYSNIRSTVQKSF